MRLQWGHVKLAWKASNIKCNPEEELEEEQARPTPPAQQDTALAQTLPQWYLKTLLDSGVTEFPIGVSRNVKPLDLMTQVIQARSFKKAKDVPPW